MRLQLCTWQDIERYLTTSKGIIVPIGSTEQHGPMGLIGTDALCPEIIANAAAETMDCLIAPTISVGMAQHHLAFPGSIALRPTTLIAVIRDTILSLARTGFERVYFFNGHGGNVATVKAAFSEVYAEFSYGRVHGPPPRCRLASWYGFRAVRTIIGELYQGQEGSHGTPGEISVTQFAYPETIRSMPETPAAPMVRGFMDADDYRALYPDGRMGSASFLASPEAGERLVHAAAKALVEDYKGFVSQP